MHVCSPTPPHDTSETILSSSVRSTSDDISDDPDFIVPDDFVESVLSEPPSSPLMIDMQELYQLDWVLAH